MIPRPTSGRYPPTLLHAIVVEVRQGLASTPDVCREHGFSAEEWREVNRRFDAGELRSTHVQEVRRKLAA